MRKDLKQLAGDVLVELQNRVHKLEKEKFTLQKALAFYSPRNKYLTVLPQDGQPLERRTPEILDDMGFIARGTLGAVK